MFQENDKIILILFSMFLVPFAMVLLFIVFHNRKNKLIQDKILEKKKFAVELAESEIEIR